MRVKSDTATIESRRNRLLELLSEGKTESQAGAILRTEGYPASHDTVERDVDALVPKWRAENASAFEQYRENQFSRITAKWAEIENDASMSGAEKHAAWARWMRLEMDLLGTAAPSKSIQAHVSSGESSPEYLEYKKAFAGLSKAQHAQELARVASVPREAVVTVKDASWFPAPQPKQLESGE
jgi:hypothetical protein